MQLTRTIRKFKFQRNLSKTENLLEKALKQEPTHENQSRVHYYQRDLSSKAFSAYEHTNVFSEQRVDKDVKLLTRAAQYLTGSQYEPAARNRPERFKEMIDVAKNIIFK